MLVGGLIAVGFGVAVLFWPAKTAVAVTGVLAVYAIAAGVVYIAVAAVARWQSTGSRIGPPSSECCSSSPAPMRSPLSRSRRRSSLSSSRS
nr:DUF308 domain-containing protein [Dietzia sp. DQ11-71]